jgi:ParB family chromosome partitioning protein
MIPIEQIEANPDQPRREFEKEALQELAESISVHGIIQPITVRRLADKQYQIISGERRWRASRLADLEEVPAFIRIANDQTLMEMALIENIQREDLNPFEIAVSYFRLKEEFELTDEVLSERVGKKRSTVTNYLRLLDLHPDVMDAMRNQIITMGHARAIAGIKDKLLQRECLKQMFDAEGKLMSVRAAEKLAKSFHPPKGKTQKKETPDTRLQAERDRILKDFKDFFGTPNIKMEMEKDSREKGKIIIEFKDNEQLNFFFKCVEQL